ncbi:hypothetical protein CDO52_01515 [Nocardiopsis gilva YIM 90087]|uniref:PIN domain-containing protein n=1 Tax=Nocardiopsis gilva YIM 90087 TaxID=1235441 RepID=A0A223S0M8_9ACTN|nr:hypothetical protein [Nocardiopsis gilva]ASU81647.1 hypothetical protein CDO52_01515 [Nocardiopsis gilva YIM 90087]
MSVRVPVYDTGMLIALAARKAKAIQMHRSLDGTPHRPIVPGPVLAQMWRPDPATVHALSTVLKESVVPQARSSPPALRPTSAGQAQCIACATAPDMADWRRIGGVLGTASLPPKKRPDVVDALVAWTAVKHQGAVVFTSDPEDLAAYLETFGAEDVHLISV